MPTTVARRAHGTGTPPIEVIVERATAFIDEHGLDALTLRALAADMGTHTASLYRRIHDREHLLDLITARIVEEADLPSTDRTQPWKHQLRETADRFRAAWLSHPHALPLLARPRFDPPTLLGLHDHISGILLNAPIDEHNAVVGNYMFLVHLTSSLIPVTADPDVLAHLTAMRQPGTTYPYLRRLTALRRSAVPGIGGTIDETMFTAVLDKILNALEIPASRATWELLDADG